MDETKSERKNEWKTGYVESVDGENNKKEGNQIEWDKITQNHYAEKIIIIHDITLQIVCIKHIFVISDQRSMIKTYTYIIKSQR